MMKLPFPVGELYDFILPILLTLFFFFTYIQCCGCELDRPSNDVTMEETSV